MGSHNIRDTSSMIDPEAAYSDLVSNAIAESGHDSYNGTISTTRGFVVSQRTPVLPAHADAIELAELKLAQKWGPAHAIAVGKATRTRTITRTVDIAKFLTEGSSPSASSIAAALGMDLSALVSYEITASDPVFETTASGKPTKHVVWCIDGTGAYETRKDALAVAKAELAARCEKLKERPEQAWMMRPVTVTQRIVTDDPLTLTPRLKRWKVTVTAYAATTAPVFDHWRFVGWAAC